MNKISLLLGLSVSASPALALTITPTVDPSVLAGKLVANQVLDSNDIKIQGTAGQIGTFGGANGDGLVIKGAQNTSMSLASGIVLSTGLLNGLPTSNTSSAYGTDTGGKGDQLINAFPVKQFQRGGGLSHDADRVRGGRSLRLPTEPCVRVRTRLITQDSPIEKLQTNALAS
ncbi:MAG: hypothetical protein LUQ11_02740, partial [Methylococcaceae bacterium]|nr:hypothetical protein [Methylococcaceae bacterium]